MTTSSRSSLTDGDRARIGALLAREQARTLERLAELRREHAGVVEASAMTSADDEHDPEGATIAYERARLQGSIDHAAAHLVAVDRAAERVREGGYGTCDRCGAPIGVERLMARPAVTSCVGCVTTAR